MTKPTKKILWEQLGKPDTSSASMSQTDKTALKHCTFYGLEFSSAASKSSMQVIIEDIRSLLSVLVTANAQESTKQL